jgi:hypothetical protein
MNKIRNPRPRFKVGDWVSYGSHGVSARVIEYRGPLGYQGQPIYRIEILREDSEPDRFEAFEEFLTAAPPPRDRGEG